MCVKTRCGTCGKTSWWGCGKHVAAVMDAVAADERCACEPAVERDGNMYPPMGLRPGGP